MNGYKLTLESDEDDRSVWLITESTSGIRQKEIVWLREGFGLDDVREAITATGWVQQDGDELRFTSAGDSLCGRTISDVLEDIFGYFNAPGNPTDELREVQSAVTEYEAMRESKLDIPLYAYAWLDMTVREDLADEARSARDLWATSTVAIDLARNRERRVEELFSRYSQREARAIGRMAGSLPTRKSDASPDAKTG